MGAIFSVPVARAEHVDELPRPADRARRPRRRAADAGRGRPGTLVVGAEREGLPAEVVAACERAAHIPIASESLNAAMAATVALYDATRTRVP